MTFGISRGIAVDSSGNVQTNVWVEVRRMTPGLPLAVPIYSDVDGAVVKDNPFFAASGEFDFFAVGGLYRVRVYKTGFEKVWEYVPVGTAQASDIDAYAAAGFTWAPESATAAPPSTGSIRFDNADVSLAAHIYISDEALSGSNAVDWLLALAAGPKSINNRVMISTSNSEEASWEVSAVSDESGYVDLTVSAYIGPAGPIDFGDAGFITVSREISGANGLSPGLTMIYDSATASADPGNGKFRLNNATHASATTGYFDNVEALAGSSITAELDSWDDSTNDEKGFLRIVSKSDASVFRLYRVTGSVVDSTGYRTVALEHVASNGALTAGDACSIAFERAGDKGNQGWAPKFAGVNDGARRVLQLVGYVGGEGAEPTNNVGEYVGAAGYTAVIGDAIDFRGTTGLTGATGAQAGHKWTFNSATASADPGSGKVAFNNAVLASATALYISETDADVQGLASMLATWDDSTNTSKGTLYIEEEGAPANFAVFNITGTITDNGGWDTFAIAHVASGGTFVNNDTLRLRFSRSGDKGTDGLGTVSAVAAGTGISVDSSDPTEPVVSVSSSLAAWEAETPPSGDVVGTSDTQTLSAKTLVDPAITGTIKEDVYTITDAAAFEIDPGNGSIQKVTLGANRTPAATNFQNGESVTLKVADGAGYTITWSTIGVVWVDGAAPTLATSGWTFIELWKVDGTVYGKGTGDVAS